MKTKWYLGFLLCLALALGILPMFSDAARAEGGNYLTFTGTGQFKLKIEFMIYPNGFEYSTDASTWQGLNPNSYVSSVNNVLYLRGKCDSLKQNSFTITPDVSGDTVACSGDIRTLMNYENPNGWTMTDYCFQELFWKNTCLTKGPDLPSMTLSTGCYRDMFNGCTALTEAPALPATTLADYCYNRMFQNCSALTAAPTLPAETMANSCYSYMFRDCTALTEAPALPARTLASSCYYAMFYGCTALTSAPALPAETLAEYCYQELFLNCKALTAAPELPAINLARSCYRDMFTGCTALTAAPALPATTLASSCYREMFEDCTAMTSTPELLAETMEDECYNGMFRGCTALTAAPELPATTLAYSCYQYMFNGCTSLTAAPELPATTLASSCYANMFDNCTSLTSAPELPATTLAGSCYSQMFSGCSKLTSAPELPATTLEYSCYSQMFSGCSNLTSAPELPATTLEYSCYSRMFYGCSNLTSAPELPATTLEMSCYQSMFSKCTSLTAAPALPATTLPYACYSQMFQGCTNIKLSTEEKGKYTKPYRIPESGAVESSEYGYLNNMFQGTGGDFTGTPIAETTYYLWFEGHMTYSANGATSGTVPTDSNIYDYGASVTLPDNTGGLAKTGFTFGGWNTKPDGTGDSYAADETFTISANTTLYAQWEKEKPRVIGASMTLSSLLRLEIRVKVPEGFDATGAYITFKLPNRDLQTVQWSGGRGTGTPNERGFDCVVRAYQLADNIGVAFHYFVNGNAYTITNDEHSAAEYLQSVIDDNKNADDVRRAKALLTYGHYLQIYLAELNGWELEDGKYSAYNEITSAYPGEMVSPDTALSGVTVIEGTTMIKENVDWAIFLLNMTDGIDLQFQIRLKDISGAITGSVNGGGAPGDLGNQIRALTKYSIDPNNLAVCYPFELKMDNATMFNAKVSPLYFVQVVMTYSEDNLEKNAMTALCNYWYQTTH